jgi:hypothetical protein
MPLSIVLPSARNVMVNLNPPHDNYGEEWLWYFESDPYNDPFLNSAGGRKELLVTKLLDPSPDFEPDSKMVIFDIVLYKG